MSRIYIILAVILIALAGGLLFLTDNPHPREITPEFLLKEIHDPARFITVDQIAERLINEDPSLLLVDVRPAEEAGSFTLPGAVSIPLADLFNEEWKAYVDQETMDVVFYSNGDLYADQAWILCKRQGYKNIYVLSGGLNRWFDAIMQPKPPAETAPSEAFDRYAFRRGAALYFSGGSLGAGSSAQDQTPVLLNKRKKKSITEGGC